MAKFPDRPNRLPGNPVSVAVGFKISRCTSDKNFTRQNLRKTHRSKNSINYKKSEKFCLFAKAIARVDEDGQIHTEVMSDKNLLK